MNGVVISIGGLHAGMLGCYGNGWIETPHFDSFAAEGFVFDQCLAETPCWTAARRSWWTGRHQCFQMPRVGESSRPGFDVSLLDALRSGGVRTVLMRDSPDPSQGKLDGSIGFDEVLEFEHRTAGGLFQAAIDWVGRKPKAERFFLFLDCRGAHRPKNSGEMLPSRGSNDESPDRNTLRELYAGQVSQLDEQLGALLDRLRRSGDWDESVVLVTSDFGEPLGAHGTTESHPPGLYEEFIHVPLALHSPGACDAASRSHALVQGVDLMPTLFEAMGIPSPTALDGCSLLPIVRFDQTRLRDYVCMGVAGHQWAIRTRMWHFVLPLPGADDAGPREPELYVKPDDRWERNNLLKQFPEVAEQLEHFLRGYAAAVALDPDQLPSLPSELGGGIV